MSANSFSQALQDIEQYFCEEPADGTPETVRFNSLSERIGLYEDEQHANISLSSEKWLSAADQFAGMSVRSPPDTTPPWM